MDDTNKGVSWVLFMFHLSARKASKRVRIWRKLQSYGALNWMNCAYLLPLNASNLEKFQWLAAEVHRYGGEGSVVEAPSVHGNTPKQIKTLFNTVRAHQYDVLTRDIRLSLRSAASRTGAQQLIDFSRLNRRVTDLAAIDFFGCPKRKEAEELLSELHLRVRADAKEEVGRRRKPGEYRGRSWLTRPRPEVDRVGSAWLIRHFIDPKAKFVFSLDAEAYPGAIRFDMFGGEFTHIGDQCTFEVLLKRFHLRDKRLKQIAQLIHDADLEDKKFGRPEGKAIELITRGWAKLGKSDEEILRQGFVLFDALYLTVGH